MKKATFMLSVGLAIGLLMLFSCQKEAFTPSNPTADAVVIDRDLAQWSPSDPCALTPVHWTGLAGKKPINTTAFSENWKWGPLDAYANDCVFGNEIPGDCEAGGTAVFFNLPAFQISNFTDADGYVSASNQRLIVNMAIAFARANISCGEGTTPTIYQMDFTRFPSGSFFGYEIQFAARYFCCPSGGSDTE